jgi:hypothetical protein
LSEKRDSNLPTSRQARDCRGENLKNRFPKSNPFSLSEKRDSNPRPPPWQGGALPTELFSQYFPQKQEYFNELFAFNYLEADANLKLFYQ